MIARVSYVKRLQVTAHVNAERAPVFFTLLAHTPAIKETRVLEWSTTVDERETVLFAIDGDPTVFAEGADDAPAVESVEFSTRRDSPTYALAVIRALETPMFEAIREARTRTGLVVRKPIVYRDGTMSFKMVGDPEQLQSALDDAPPGVSVQLDEIESVLDESEPESALSERQHEALECARKVGYYDHPRRATQSDVADELGCAPQTAGEHLQKAEAKLVNATLDGFDLR